MYTTPIKPTSSYMYMYIIYNFTVDPQVHEHTLECIHTNVQNWFDQCPYLIILHRKLCRRGLAVSVLFTEAGLHSLSPIAAARGQYLGRRKGRGREEES